MRFSRFISIGLCLSAIGCHTFRPVGLEELDPGMEIRARVSAAQAAELSEYLPTEKDGLIEGTVISASPGQLLLFVPVTTRNVPGQMETLGQRLEIPSDGIFEVELREFDRSKTVLAAASVASLIGYILYATLRKGSSGGTPGAGGPGPEDSVVLFRIPIGP